MGELGLMGIPFPTEYGGGGADNLSYALAVEELARIDSSVAITMAAHTSLGTMPIYLWGDDAQREEWLPQLCSGERLAAFGLTEPEAGSDAGNTRTRAALDGGEWVIDGAKQFITNSGTDISGLRDDHRPHRRGRDLEHHRPERDPRLRDRRGLPEDGLERLRHAAAQLRRLPGPRGQPARPARTGLQAVPADPRRRPDRRRRDGPRARPGRARRGASPTRRSGAPSASRSRSFQAIQAKIADIATEIEAARLLTYRAAVLKDRGEPFSLTAAQAKLKTGRLAVRAAEEAVQIHGGYGYIEEYPVCRFYRDAKILTIGEGTDEVQQMVIARALGC